MRKFWVTAIECALELETPADFMGWLNQFVRPVLHYEMVVCATGVFAPHAVRTDRLLVRGFPRTALESLRDAGGVIHLPRGRRPRDVNLRSIDVRSLEETLKRGRPPGSEAVLGTLAALDRIEASCRFGSYFLFGKLAETPTARQHYLAAVLGPVMHTALMRTLDADPAFRPQASPGVRLTRRETELLGWLVAGQTTVQIAAASFRSAHTVANQVRAILRKLDARNRTEAIALAFSLGLVQPQERPRQTRVIAAQIRAPYITRGEPSGPLTPSRSGFMPKAVDVVIVDDTDGLQIGVDDGRTDELEAEFA
jgi:DNA-binding CsgD family transcriptional regulator